MHHPIPLFAVVDGMTLATVRAYTSRVEAEAVADAMNVGVGGLYRVVETPAAPAQPEAATAAA